MVALRETETVRDREADRYRQTEKQGKQRQRGTKTERVERQRDRDRLREKRQRDSGRMTDRQTGHRWRERVSGGERILLVSNPKGNLN